MSFIIKDWAGNELSFNPKSNIVKEFNSFDDAESFLCEFFDDNGWDYDEHRGEYYIEEKKS
jgi:hypothetical protein